MYFDNRPCDVCGADVRLQARDPERDTVVEPDGTIDERVCTNPECPTNTGQAGDQRP